MRDLKNEGISKKAPLSARFRPGGSSRRSGADKEKEAAKAKGSAARGARRDRDIGRGASGDHADNPFLVFAGTGTTSTRFRPAIAMARLSQAERPSSSG